MERWRWEIYFSPAAFLLEGDGECGKEEVEYSIDKADVPAYQMVSTWCMAMILIYGQGDQKQDRLSSEHSVRPCKISIQDDVQSDRFLVCFRMNRPVPCFQADFSSSFLEYHRMIGLFQQHYRYGPEEQPYQIRILAEKKCTSSHSITQYNSYILCPAPAKITFSNITSNYRCCNRTYKCTH